MKHPIRKKSGMSEHIVNPEMDTDQPLTLYDANGNELKVDPLPWANWIGTYNDWYRLAQSPHLYDIYGFNSIDILISIQEDHADVLGWEEWQQDYGAQD